MHSEVYSEVRERAVELQVFTSRTDSLKWDIKGIPGFSGKIGNVREELADKISDGWKIIICTSFEGQARRLADLLDEFNPDTRFEVYNPDSVLNILIAPLQGGFYISSLKIIILTDQDIFGKKYRKRTQFKKKTSRPISTGCPRILLISIKSCLLTMMATFL